MSRFLIAALICAGPIFVGCDDPEANAMIGASPDFQVESLQSSSIKTTLKSFQGKAVLIDFWASWCGPCRQLCPYVEEVYQKHRNEGLEAMAIAEDTRDNVAKYEQASPHRMPVYVDPNSVAGMAFKVDAFPTVAVVGKSGKITYITAGFNTPFAAQQEIDKAVTKALAG